MEIISHRGFWNIPEEKNTEQAFIRSFQCGFGIETDIRDLNGHLVISHDIPSAHAMLLKDFCSLPGVKDFTLALNVKSDGLALTLQKTLREFGINKWFVFDMSVPDTLGHINSGNPFFTRLSDIEHELILLDESEGVWLDAFKSDWYSNDVIQKLLDLGKKVCIVSPELHGRDYTALWEQLISIRTNKNLILCTDFPLNAKQFFNK